MATNAELAAMARNEIINNLGRKVSAQEFSMLDGLLEGVSSGEVFSLAAYGATGDGSTDDGPAIRLALAAAYAAGGGLVEGMPGKNYRVVPLLVTGASYTAWRALAMREGVTLDFKGSTVTVVAQTAGADGCVISANGTESATTDYGAEGNWTIRNAVFATTDSSSKTTGNVLVFLRCHGATAENISISTAFAYHVIEFNNCRMATARNITIGYESGVGVAGGPYPEIQFDTGNPAAPVGSYAHTALLDDILLENVQMRDLGRDSAKVRRVEIGHGLATYRRITIRGGYYAGLVSGSGVNDAAVMDINTAFANTYEDLLIDGVTFDHDSMGSGGACACFKVPDSANVTLRGLEIRNCLFKGNYRFGVQVGSGSNVTFSAARVPQRRGIHIHNNRFTPGQIGRLTTLTSTGVNVSDGDTTVLGGITYRFKTVMTQAYDVQIMASAALTLAAYKKAVNATGVAGTDYYAGTLVNPQYSAGTITATTLECTLLTSYAGTVTEPTESAVTLSWVHQIGTTRVICVQGCEDAVIENNYELSPATQTHISSNGYNSISVMNNFRAHVRNNVIQRQQAAAGDLASGDNNVIYVRISEALATSGTQEIVVENTGNSVYGIHRITVYESGDPSAWAAGAYTRIRGTRANNIAHTAPIAANEIVLPIGLWPAPAGTLLTGAASTDDTAAGLYAADGGNIASTITTVNTLAGHVATALYTTNMPTSAGQRAVLTPSRAV